MRLGRTTVLHMLLCFYCCSGFPVNREGAQVKEKHDSNDIPSLDPQEYIRYLQELTDSDPEFMERLNKVKGLDMAKLQQMIVNHPHLRDRLLNNKDHGAMRNRVDEAKRITVEQMRQLQKLQTMRNENLLKDGDWMTKKEAMRENLSPNFNNKDIQAKMIAAKQKLEELDRIRKEEFKQQEMYEEHRRRQKLKDMNEQQRLKAEDEFRKRHEELRKHERLPQPGSKEQLEQVWEEDDGLAREEFDPRTFFHMHDTNADRTLDAMEVEALFYSELKKVYKDDMNSMEANEDLARMREYAMSEIDKDKDGLLSFEEFMGYTKDKSFEEKKEWHPVVDEDTPFSDKEFEQYEDDYEEDYDYQYDDKGNIIGIVPREKKHGDNKHPDQPGNAPPPQHRGDQQSPPPHEGNQNAPPPQHQGVPDPAHQQQGGDHSQPPPPPPGVHIDDPDSLVIKPSQPDQPHHETRMAPPSSHAPPAAEGGAQKDHAPPAAEGGAQKDHAPPAGGGQDGHAPPPDAQQL